MRTPGVETLWYYAELDPLVGKRLSKILEPPHRRGRGWTGLHEAHLAQVRGMPRGNGAQQALLELVPTSAQLETESARALALGNLIAWQQDPEARANAKHASHFNLIRVIDPNTESDYGPRHSKPRH